MSHSARLALIAALMMRHSAPKVAAALPPSRHDIREETSLVVSGQDSGELPASPTAEDDGNPLPSALPFDPVKLPSEGEGVISPSEVKALRREGIDYRPFVTKAAPAMDDANA